MYKAPLVVRAHFHAEAEALEAHAQLGNIGVFGDTHISQEHKSHTVIFLEPMNVNMARNTVKRIPTRPFLVEVFFQEDMDNGVGWSSFKTI